LTGITVFPIRRLAHTSFKSTKSLTVHTLRYLTRYKIPTLNFFGAQDKANRESFLLIIAFSVAMVFNALMVNSLAKGVTSVNFLSWGIVAVIWLPVLISCRKRWRDLRSGGHLMAATYGGMFISEHIKDRQDRKLLNVTAEMALASSQEKPSCYCLRDETNINAFVIGTKADTVLVVSQGAIDWLGRDELQAMIAHEFGHLSNNDLTINMRLLVVLGGLSSIHRFGKEQLALAASKKVRIVNNHKRDENDHWGGVIVFWLFGTFFRFVGYPLVFSGDVIKAAFSRKREYLADAKATQYTRYPRSLASALHKASSKSTDSALHTCYASELDHLCFFGPWKHRLFAGLLASHPSPQSRIDLIDPTFVPNQKPRSRSNNKNREASPSSFASTVEPVSIPLLVTDFGVSTLPMHQLSEELAIVLSVVVSTCGYDETKMKRHHKQLLKGYTAEAHPMHMTTEPGFDDKLDSALDALLLQSATQRRALIEHILEIVEHDNIVSPEEKRIYEYMCERLNPPAKAA